ncbi:MAG TPA: hypothetical protein VMK32_11955 [Burkholderiaceae bacterium]|nr:hypothetical protein [Burkholderiaceae bacterium]
MPRSNTKAQKAIKAGSKKRVIYVSWLQIESVEQKRWFMSLWDRLRTDLSGLDDEFETPLQTVHDLQTKAERAGALRKPVDYTDKASPVTDVIAVLTDKYVVDNTGKANGELARFVDRVRAGDPERRVRIFLAPVIPPSWHLWKVRDVLLATRDAPWLVRLKEKRFVWPNENPGASLDEIAAAVWLIIGKEAVQQPGY